MNIEEAIEVLASLEGKIPDWETFNRSVWDIRTPEMMRDIPHCESVMIKMIEDKVRECQL